MKKPTRVELKRQRRRVFFRLVLLMALVAFLVAYAFKSDFFNIEHINVEGNHTLKDDLIINASRINLGENILRIDSSDGQKEIKLLPYIKEAVIDIKLPKTINITVEEREGILQIKSLSSYALVDYEGVILEVTDNKIENIPSFIGFDLKDIKPGENILKDEAGSKLLDFFNDVEILSIIEKISDFNYTTGDGEINISLINGISVAFGPLDNVKYKIKVLDKLLIDIEKKQIPCKMIIMNKGENPIVVTDN